MYPPKVNECTDKIVNFPLDANKWWANQFKVKNSKEMKKINKIDRNLLKKIAFYIKKSNFPLVIGK